MKIVFTLKALVLQMLWELNIDFNVSKAVLIG